MRYAHPSADARRDAVQLLDAHNHRNLPATRVGEAWPFRVFIGGSVVPAQGFEL
jgi:hypothetical protein